MIYLKQTYNSNHELIEETYIYKKALENFINDVQYYENNDKCISDFHEDYIVFEYQGYFAKTIIELRLLNEKR